MAQSPATIRTSMHEAQATMPAVLGILCDTYRVSVTQLAATLDVTRETIYKKLSGESAIRQDELRALSLFFAVPPELFWTQPRDALRWLADEGPEPAAVAKVVALSHARANARAKASVRSRCFSEVWDARALARSA
jgi:hypothetical protein